MKSNLYKYLKNENQISYLNIRSGRSIIHLHSPEDIKLDSFRRKLWVSDTGNHRLLCVDADSFSLISSFSFENLMFCFEVGINDADGSVLSRWFDSETLEERLVYIKDGEVKQTISSFSEFPWGVMRPEEINNGILVNGRSSGVDGVYEMSSDGMDIQLKIRNDSVQIRKMSVNPINGEIFLLGSDGRLMAYTIHGKFIDQIGFRQDPQNVLFTSFYGDANWTGNYRHAANAHYPILSRISVDKKAAISNGVGIRGLIRGVCCFSDMRPVYLAGGGESLITLKRDGRSIHLQTMLNDACDLISQDATNGDLFLARQGGTKLKRYNKDHEKMEEIELSKEIKFIDSKSDGLGRCWVLSSENDVYSVFLGDSPSVESALAISDTRTLKEVRSDFSSGGVFVNSTSSIHKISEDGEEIEFSRFSIVSIEEVVPKNYLYELYKGRRAILPNKQSIVFDYVRSQAWWVSNHEKMMIGMVNFLNNTGSVLELD